MTIYQPNPDVRPTGEEAGEFIEPQRPEPEAPEGSGEPPEEPAGEPEPSDEKMYTSEPLEDEDGNTYVVRQQNVGPGNEMGGGEWPDPHTPPQSPAPGAT